MIKHSTLNWNIAIISIVIILFLIYILYEYLTQNNINKSIDNNMNALKIDNNSIKNAMGEV